MLIRTVAIAIALLAFASALFHSPQSSEVTLSFQGRQVTDASGIWSMSNGDILTVMETEGGVVGLQLRSISGALQVYLGSVSGNQLSLTGLDGVSSLSATVSGASMNGSFSGAGASAQFSAARVLAPIGSRVDGIYQTSLGSFLLHFSTDSDDIPVVVFDLALMGGTISFDIFLGQTSSADFAARFVGDSVFGPRTLRTIFRGLNAAGTYTDASVTSFAASSLLRFCPDPNDFDGDGVVDDCDRCPVDPDPTQADADGDGAGDACDLCSGADDFADADANGVPDCRAAVGDYAGAAGIYAIEDFQLRFNCHPDGTRIEVRTAFPNLTICGVPQNNCRTASMVNGDDALFENVQYLGNSYNWLTDHDRLGDDDDDPEQFGDDDDDGRNIVGPLFSNLNPERCQIDAVGPFVGFGERSGAQACRYLATFVGSCPGIGAQAELCFPCPNTGRCYARPTATYTILLGTGTQTRECRAQLSRIDLKCGACEGLPAIPRPDRD